MAYILSIESSSTVCSVALSLNQEVILSKELNNGYTHAENLHIFIQQIITETNISLSQLNAVAVSEGPGSYTGLRIGYTTAKGLAYSLNIPLISIDSLQALCVNAIQKKDINTIYCPMIDARRMEVFYGTYSQSLQLITKPTALILNEESVQVFNTNNPICFFGDGMPKAKTLLQSINKAIFIENIVASSSAVSYLAYQKYLVKDFADTVYAVPNYLKEFYFQNATK